VKKTVTIILQEKKICASESHKKSRARNASIQTTRTQTPRRRQDRKLSFAAS